MKKSTYEVLLDAAEAFAIENKSRVLIKTRPHKGNKTTPSMEMDINNPAFAMVVSK